jgi:hypothetical protein
MTTPVRAETNLQTGERFYPRPDGSGASISVTSVMNVLPKQMYLVPWAAKTVAEVAVEIMQDLMEGTKPEQAYLDAFYDAEEGDYDWDVLAETLKTMPLLERDDAGSLGDIVHDVANQILRLSNGSYEIAKALYDDMLASHELEPPVADRIEYLLHFLKDNMVVVINDEFTVYNDKYSYAGTCDLAAYVNGQPYIIDIKTNKMLSNEIAMQIAAYAHGEYIVEDDGTRSIMPFKSDDSLTKEVKGAILHLQPTQCKLREVDITPDVFDAFLAFKIAKSLWFDGAAKTALGDVVYKYKKGQ